MHGTQVESLEGQEVTKFCPVGKRIRNVQMAKWKDVHPVSRKNSLCLISVAALWGLTNPLLKKNSKGIEEINRDGKLSQLLAEFFFLITNWKYILSFVMNQTGSLVYYITLSSADLTLAVPITNSMTFIFTALSSHVLGEKQINFNTLVGITLVAAGVLLCVLGKIETAPS